MWGPLLLPAAGGGLVPGEVEVVQQVHDIATVDKVEAMALMERSDEGTEGPGVVWI